MFKQGEVGSSGPPGLPGPISKIQGPMGLQVSNENQIL